MYTFQTSGKITIFVGAVYPVIYLHPFSGEGQKVYEAAQAAGYPPFTLVTINDLEM